MPVDNWPGRGYYRGNKQAMLSETAKLFSGTMIATPVPVAEAVETPAPIVPPPAMADTVIPTKMSAQTARQLGYTGNTCTTCGSSKMQVAGHCEVCVECGSSSGCS